MPRSSKNKKTCFSRKELRNKVNRRVRTTIKRVIRKAVQTRRKKLSKILRTLRKQKGGNYTTDATVTQFDGQDIKAPNTIVVATKDGKVMSASAYQRSLDSLSIEAY
jgi:vacuolar-type H+-ATPase subunit E/Vma4